MLDNPRAERVKAVARLSQKGARLETGLFLLEGPQSVAEALAYRPELVVELYATPTALERYSDIAETAVAAGVDVEFASERVIDAMADTVSPQGIVAVVHQFPTALKHALIAGRSTPKPRLVVVLEEVRDPGNLGTIIRVADAAGSDAVILAGRSVDLYNPKVVRSAVGSLFHVPIVVDVTLEAALDAVRSAGLHVFAADMHGDALPTIRESGALVHPIAWLFGNEARGLSSSARDAADRVVSIPLYGDAESLNLATAASVCLYETAFAQQT